MILDVNGEDQQINSLNINVIASEPNSNTIDNYKSYSEEQFNIKQEIISFKSKLQENPNVIYSYNKESKVNLFYSF